MRMKWLGTDLTCVAMFVLIAGIGGCTGDGPVGDPDNGMTLYLNGDGVSAFSCADCHCSDASGGCLSNAPNIQGESFAAVDARTRDPLVSHAGGKFQFTEQDAADIAAYLATQGAPKHIVLPFQIPNRLEQEP